MFSVSFLGLGFAETDFPLSPKNYFEQIHESSAIVKAKILEEKSYDSNFRLLRLSVEGTIRGKVGKELWVVKDVIMGTHDGGGLFLLKNLPSWTSYQPLHQQGITLQIISGKHQLSEIELVKNYLKQTSPGEEKSFLLAQMNKINPSIDAEIFSYLLKKEDLIKILSSADVVSIGSVWHPSLPQPTQEALLELLKKIATPEAINGLKTLSDQSQGAVQRKALFALHNLRQTFSKEQLLNYYAKTSEKIPFLSVIASLGPDWAASFLHKEILFNQDPLFRGAGFQQLVKLGLKSSEGILLEFVSLPDPFLQAEGMKALGKLDSVKAVPIAERWLQSKNPQLRTAAMLALQGMANPQAAAIRAKYYEEGHDHGVSILGRWKHFGE